MKSILMSFCLLCAFGSLVLSQSLGIQGTSFDVDIHGKALVIDRGASMLRLYSLSGSLVKEIGGQGWGNDQFDSPSGVWAKNGVDVFVADFGNHRVQRFDKDLAFVSSLSTRDGDDPDARFGYPSSVSVSRLGDLFVCDTENSRIVRFGNATTPPTNFGGFSAGKGRLTRPTVVACGPGDQVLVLDGGQVKVYDSFGNFVGVLPTAEERPVLLLAADESGAVVLDSTAALVFDRSLRPVSSITLAQAGFRPGHVLAASLNDGKVFLLADGRIVAVQDPRHESQLENDTKSH